MKKLFILLPFFCFNILSAQNKKIESLAIQFIDTVQTHAYHSSKIDWDTFRPQYFQKVNEIQNSEELYPLFKEVIDSLKDGHSLINSIKSEEEEESKEDFFKKYAKLTDEGTGAPKKNFDAKLLEGKYGYINIPGIMLEFKEYVQTIGQQLSELDKQNPKAWIIDLSENWGGTIIPMLWHLHSLIDEGESYEMVYANGQIEKQPTRFDLEQDEDNKLIRKYFDIEGEIPIQIKNNKIPIVILTSSETSSSGEMLLSYFLGQENVTVIGQKTGGYTSGNKDFRIGDYQLLLTAGVIKDRSGKVYAIGESIQPDIEFEVDLTKRYHGPITNTNQQAEAMYLAKEDYIEQALLYLNANPY